jgi:chromosome segregation ATPase
VIYEALIFALGFLVAGLLTLLILPAVWRRAVRLSARRLEMQMPLSMTEIVAERDQLRAEFAVTQRRMEQNSERLTRTIAETQSELGRRAIQIAALQENLATARARVGSLDKELSDAQRATNETQAELVASAKAHYDASGRLEDTQNKLFQLERAHRGLNEIADQRRTAIAALETRVSGLELRIEDLRRELAEAGSLIERKNRELLTLADERDITKAELGVAQIRGENLHSQIGGYTDQIASLSAEVRHLRESSAFAQRQHSEQLAAIAGYESTLVGNARLTDEVQGRLERAKQHALVIENRYSQRLDVLRQEKAAVDGALEAARNERDKLKQELAAHRSEDRTAIMATPETDIALLRAAIADMAADVLRLAGNQDGPTDAGPRSLSPKRPIEQPGAQKTFGEQKTFPEKKRAIQSSNTKVRN